MANIRDRCEAGDDESERRTMRSSRLRPAPKKTPEGRKRLREHIYKRSSVNSGHNSVLLSFDAIVIRCKERSPPTFGGLAKSTGSPAKFGGPSWDSKGKV
jgi:hypothetical protein